MIKGLALLINIGVPLLWGVGMFFFFEKFHNRNGGRTSDRNRNNNG